MKEVQDALPWALGYSEAFSQSVRQVRVGARFSDGSSMEHLDFSHAVLHIVKATGKLAAMSENADHDRRESSVPNGSVYDRTDFPLRDVEKYAADLVICAMRLANVRPGGSFDLWGAVLRRLDDKNGTRLSHVPTTERPEVT